MKLVNTVAMTLSVAFALNTAVAASNQYLAISTDSVVDIKTISGDVVTIDELKDGYSQVAGTRVVGPKLVMKRNAPIADMQLSNGEIVDFKTTSDLMLMGGDMGGGGKDKM